MMRTLCSPPLMKLAIGVLLVSLLTGCAGLALLTLVAKVLTIGEIFTRLDDLVDRFDKDGDEYEVLFDGYQLDKRPEKNGDLELTGLPVGSHLISVVDDDRRTGLHAQVLISAGQQQLDLDDTNALEGATISGRVERDVSGNVSRVAHVPVIAIKDGAQELAASGGSAIVIPPAQDTCTYVMGYTDASGDYKLGPCAYGTWLVAAYIPGYYADARIVDVSGGSDASGRNLMLTASAEDISTVTGSVTDDGSAGIAQALVYAELGTAHSVGLTQSRADDVEDDAGFAMISGPWFAWRGLGTETDDSGAYTLRTVPGSQRVVGFKYEYQAKYADMEPDASQALELDFSLEER